MRVSNGGYSRRTFPDSAPGTDGVAIFEGRVIDRVQHMTNLPGDPKWSWSVTDPELGVTLAADDRKPAAQKGAIRMTRSPEASREAAMARIRGVESLSQPSKRLYSVLMPGEITAALEKATDEDGISSADLIRQAVADHLRGKGYLPKG